jgi:hypothetical protein
MTTPAEVTKALNHVRSVFPQVTSVRYDDEGRWLFTDSHGDAPAFNGKIDIGILEDAADAVYGTHPTPAYFNV